jgi:IS1 family transposase
MNKLSAKERAHILQLLCEGMSIRAIERATGSSKHTVERLLNDAGRAMSEYQDRVLRDLSSKRVQCDEIWSFCYAKAKNVAKATAAPEGAGDVWTWTAIDADTKLIISYFVGARTRESAMILADDMRARIVSDRVQITTDNNFAYKNPLEEAFGADMDYATLEKVYRTDPKVGAGRYSPPVCIGARKRTVYGAPDPEHVSTSYVERQNLTMRMHMRRFTRLTNGFSKKLEHHANAVSLHFGYYNFVRVHKTLRMTPAMAAGVTDRLWDMSDLVAVLEAWEADRAKPAKRGHYKKRAA